MLESTVVTIGIKEFILGILAFFGFNVAGWRMFATTKLKQLEDHEKRLKSLEDNHKYTIAVADHLKESLFLTNKKIDAMDASMKQIFNEILEIYKKK